MNLYEAEHRQLVLWAKIKLDKIKDEFEKKRLAGELQGRNDEEMYATHIVTQEYNRRLLALKEKYNR